tara:strand:+ start:3788 stop:4171 length:384 start_codon:yes stop_codon:yes gene_type:complete
LSNSLQDPVSGLILPRQFVDEKQALKKVIDDVVDKAVNAYQYIKGTYFLVIHAKFDSFDPSKFNISTPVASMKLPPFVSNQMVFWVNNAKGICEILWMVTRGQDKKLKVEFNKTGVAYLQAKGAMPS